MDMKQLLLLTAIFLTACGPAKINSERLRQIDSITYFGNTPFTGWSEDKHFNRQIKVAKEYVDGLVVNGSYNVYDSDRKVVGKEVYDKGKKKLIESYFQAGELKSRERYLDGQLVLLTEHQRYNNLLIKQVEHQPDGKTSRIEQEWHSNGKILFERQEYENNVLVKYLKKTSGGAIWSRLTYKNGKKTGVEKEFCYGHLFDNAKWIRNYKDGERHGYQARYDCSEHIGPPITWQACYKDGKRFGRPENEKCNID
jgi:antitoxin component YwqK of YwqJK toxin-antitoxin module